MKGSWKDTWQNEDQHKMGQQKLFFPTAVWNTVF
jgi:hypothetical protein